MDELFAVFAEFAELWHRFRGFLRDHWKVYVGLVVGILVMIAEIIHMRKQKPPVNKKVQRARELGHVTRGIRQSHRTHEDDDRTTYSAKYAYEVDGMKYAYKYYGDEFPPLELDLYYFNNPRRAFHEKKSQLRSCLAAALFYLIPFLASCLVIHLLGGIE
ncbi:MAG: hypothetical protein QM270_11450 [Bacillota bacterium]|nr:hypothetical protein [Bacillota bacterium]